MSRRPHELTARLRALMISSASGMTEADGALVAPRNTPAGKGGPMWFGRMREGKACFSYHLMPVHTHAALAAKITPALRKQMQGKSCFNFEVADEALFDELAARGGGALRRTPYAGASLGRERGLQRQEAAVAQQGGAYDRDQQPDREDLDEGHRQTHQRV